MEVNDRNYYPKPFSKRTVTSTDDNGYPTITKFYHRDDKTQLIFTWLQEWNESGICTSWEIIVENE